MWGKTVAVTGAKARGRTEEQGRSEAVARTEEQYHSDKIRLGGNLLLLENSELLCSLGGRIRIFYTLAAASAACGASREEERSFWSKAIDFGKGLGKGLWKGLKGTVTGVIDLGIWAGKHSLPYILQGIGNLLGLLGGCSGVAFLPALIVGEVVEHILSEILEIGFERFDVRKPLTACNSEKSDN